MIPQSDYDLIRGLNVDIHNTECQFEYWENEFIENEYIYPKIIEIKNNLSETFNRTELVDFYRRENIATETKFIATMIWGHEAPAGSRRDARGPWKLSQMFEDSNSSQRIIRESTISTNEEIKASYKALNKNIKRCGPNFFTKHFYFLGKSLGAENYPVIFDDRVANGILKLSLSNDDCMEILKVSAKAKPEAYISFLRFVFEQARIIGCEPDQIEYYLFTL